MKLPTIWTDEKHSQEEAQAWRKSEGRRSEAEKIRDGEVRRGKMQVREKVGKSRNTVFFKCLVAPRSSGGCRDIWPDERSKVARRCGVKHIWK